MDYLNQLSHFVAPNRRAINLCQLLAFFLNKMYVRWRYFCVRRTKFSWHLAPPPLSYVSLLIFPKKYTSKPFLDVNIGM